MKNKLLKCLLESPHLRSHRSLEHKELDKHRKYIMLFLTDNLYSSE